MVQMKSNEEEKKKKRGEGCTPSFPGIVVFLLTYLLNSRRKKKLYCFHFGTT